MWPYRQVWTKREHGTNRDKYYKGCLQAKQMFSQAKLLPTIESNLSTIKRPHWTKWTFFGQPAGSRSDTEEMTRTAYWPFGVVGRVLGGFFQQRDVDQSTSQNEQYCDSMGSPAERTTERGLLI